MKLNRLRNVAASTVFGLGLLGVACSDDGDGNVGDGDGDGTGGTAVGDGDGDETGGASPGDGDGDETGGTDGLGGGDGTDGTGGTDGLGGGGAGGIDDPDPVVDEFAEIQPVFASKVAVADGLVGVDITSDGLVYVAGTRVVNVGTVEAPVNDKHIVVARYTAEGVLDENFADAGVALINVIAHGDDDPLEAVPGDEVTSSVVAMPDGGAVVAVEANDGALGGDVVLVRLDAIGDPEETFGTLGVATVPMGDWTLEAWNNAGQLGGPSDRAYHVSLDTSGDEDRLVIFGSAPATASTGRTDNDRYVARVMASTGALDATFATGGLYSIDFAGRNLNDSARRGAVAADGSVYSFGYTNLGVVDRNHIFLLKLDESGQPFPGFGFVANATSCGALQPGVICANPNLAGGGFAEAYSAAVQSDGGIVTTGYGRTDAATLPPDLVSFRFSATAMDSTYALGGGLILDSGAEDRGRDVVAMEDDRIVHVGKYAGVSAIYVTEPDGALWSAFGDGGIRVYPTHDGNFRAVATRDGLIAAVADGGTTVSSFLVILKVAE